MRYFLEGPINNSVTIVDSNNYVLTRGGGNSYYFNNQAVDESGVISGITVATFTVDVQE